MFREIACAAVVLAVTTLTACHPAKDSAAPETTQPAATITSTTPAAATTDQSKTFFPSTVDSYGLDHTGTDRDHFAELYALRQIDPCGFVDEKTMVTNGHEDFGYTYAAVHAIAADGPSPTTPLAGTGCTVAVPAAPVGLSLQVLPGEPTGIDSQFGASQSGVAQRDTPCVYRVSLPLTRLSGAPSSMHDPQLQVSLRNIADDHVPTADPASCRLAEAVATSAATQVQDNGVPAYSSSAARILTADPCAAAPNLGVTGATWNEPNPQAQHPTTWRHPSVCNLALQGDDASAVVRYGVAAWSDTIVESLAGDPPTRNERDGVELTGFGSDSRCFVVARGTDTLTPVVVGAGAPHLQAPTPVVTVQLSGVGGQCLDTAETAALAALKRVV